MATDRFVGRQSELQALEDLYERPGGQLFVLYGRRRVGRTELVRQFCRGKRHVYFQAAQESDRDNLRYFVAEADQGTGDPAPRTPRRPRTGALPASARADGSDTPG